MVQQSARTPLVSGSRPCYVASTREKATKTISFGWVSPIAHAARMKILQTSLESICRAVQPKPASWISKIIYVVDPGLQPPKFPVGNEIKELLRNHGNTEEMKTGQLYCRRSVCIHTRKCIWACSVVNHRCCSVTIS